MAKDENGSGFVWFLAGTVIGVGVAFLFAPKSGKESRQYIGRTTDRGREALTESGRDLVERGKDLYERGRALADDAADLFERGRKLVKG